MSERKVCLGEIYLTFPLKTQSHTFRGVNLSRRFRYRTSKYDITLGWNALITVLKANKDDDLGGHISTYSSAATLYEGAFNHFFRGNDNQLGDLVFFRGHSSPGIYARSYLEEGLRKKIC